MFEEFKRVKKEPEPLSVKMTGEPYQPANKKMQFLADLSGYAVLISMKLAIVGFGFIPLLSISEN